MTAETAATIVAAGTCELPLPHNAGSIAAWRLHGDGYDAPGRTDGDCIRFELPLPAGSYHLEPASAATTAAKRSLVLARPARAYVPEPLQTGRAWGFALNLYALRSARNWGIGDFTDLKHFMELAGQHGASLVGVNPLHALHWNAPEEASPYAPASRFFLNPLYIDVSAIPEYAGDRNLHSLIESLPFARALESARRATLVNYAAVSACKARVLELLFARFDARASSVRRVAFEAFRAAGGSRLERFARYEALAERLSPAGGACGGWLDWPRAFQDPESAAVARFAFDAAARVRFFTYLQWIAEEQLRAAALAAGAGVALYRDLAVGVDLDSADVWSARDAYVLDESLGAPPDDLAREGQNWHLPPPKPAALLEGEANFAALLRANMAHAGALRIDHVMALRRLFRIRRGRPAAEGTYVQYPFDALLAVATIESERERCLIVGEDLGTVPSGFRERTAAEGIFSYRLLLFERSADGSFRLPEDYPALALATASTHDLPTVAGWALGRDLQARAELPGGPRRVPESASADRRRDAGWLADVLERRAGLTASERSAFERALDRRSTEREAYEPFVRAAYRYLAATPARLVLVQLDDVLIELDQVNLPGTVVEYPNWRRRNAAALGEPAFDDRLARFAREVGAGIAGGSIG